MHHLLKFFFLNIFLFFLSVRDSASASPRPPVRVRFRVLSTPQKENTDANDLKKLGKKDYQGAALYHFCKAFVTWCLDTYVFTG